MAILTIGSRCLPFFSDVLRKIMSAGTRWFCYKKKGHYCAHTPHACTAPSQPRPQAKATEEKEHFFVKPKLGIHFAWNPKLTSLQNPECRITTGASSHWPDWPTSSFTKELVIILEVRRNVKPVPVSFQGSSMLEEGTHLGPTGTRVWVYIYFFFIEYFQTNSFRGHSCLHGESVKKITGGKKRRKRTSQCPQTDLSLHLCVGYTKHILVLYAVFVSDI